MADMFEAARRIADQLDPTEKPASSKGAVVRKGIIVSYSAGRATVTIGGDTTEIPNVPVVAPWDGVDYASPDNVLLLQDEGVLVVLLKLS